jgi:tryptophan-rich sensory protein
MSKFSAGVQFLGLAAWLGASFAAAATGAAASIHAKGFYAALNRPAWAPPAAVFGPVWTILYILMGLAAWLVWREKGLAGAKAALILFGLQLALNCLWSWLFFGWRLGLWSSIDIVLLLGFIGATSIAFWMHKAAAGALMMPYLLWVGYATALNVAIWRMNLDLL